MAINTNVCHQQVTNLKVGFIVFLICLIAITISGYVALESEFQKMSSYVDDNMKWVKDQYYINNLIHLSFNISDVTDNQALYHSIAAMSRNYSITFDPEIVVNLYD